MIEIGGLVFQSFLSKILDFSVKGSFKEQTRGVIDYIATLTDSDIKIIVKEIGTIPECIKASSSEKNSFQKLLM